MRTCTVSRTVAASVEEVWSVVGDPSSITRWNVGVGSVVLEDDVRRADLRGDTVVERITRVDDVAHVLEYVLVTGPVAFTSYRSEIAVLPAEAGSTVVWTAELGLDDPHGEEASVRAVSRLYAAGLARLDEVLTSG